MKYPLPSSLKWPMSCVLIMLMGVTLVVFPQATLPLMAGTAIALIVLWWKL